MSAPILIIYGLTSFASVQTPVFSNTYQGLGIRYDSVYFKNYWYDSFNHGPNPNYYDNVASVAKFGEYCVLNPDGNNELLPSLKMSGSSVVVDPTQQFVPTTWSIKDEYASNSQFDVYDTYQMQKFEAEWAFNLWIDGTGNEAYPDINHIWQNAQIWIEVTPQTFCYFDNNEEELYFAPAYIGVKEVKWFSGTEDPNQMSDPTQASYNDLYPEVVGDNFGIFAQKGEVSEDINEDTILSYNGQDLDSDVFRESYWIRMNVDKLQADSEANWWGGWDWKYVSCQIVCEVHLFVIGEWRVVLEKGDIPDLEPREPDFGFDWFGEVLDDIWAFATSPTGIFLAILAVIAVVIVFIFISGSLPSVLALLAVSKSRGNG